MSTQPRFVCLFAFVCPIFLFDLFRVAARCSLRTPFACRPNQHSGSLTSLVEYPLILQKTNNASATPCIDFNRQHDLTLVLFALPDSLELLPGHHGTQGLWFFFTINNHFSLKN